MAKTKAKIAYEVRKRKSEKGLRRIQIYVSEETHTWLKDQETRIAETIENLVKEKFNGT